MPTSAVFIDSNMFFQPPAKSPAPIKSLFNLLIGKTPNFERTLQHYLGAYEVVIGDAWVVVLAEGLKALKARRKGNKIVLPAYSCNEFTKAILLADLQPLYVDLGSDYRMSLAEVSAVPTSDLLGVLMVNNTGIVAENEKIRAYCDDVGIFCIEDAGYTLFGSNADGQTYGSFGHVAIVNMSEGKIVPAGGAAWVVNHKDALETADVLRTAFSSLPKRTNFSEALQLLIYRLGTSTWGFHFYTRIKNAGLGDLKARFSSEPTRKGENYATGELEWFDGKIRLNPSHEFQLRATKVRPWNSVRNAWALQLFHRREAELAQRAQKAIWWYEALEHEVEWLPLATMPMFVKLPVLMDIPMNLAKSVEHYGIKKQYPPTWPMNRPEFKHAERCYREAYTLPVHHGIKKAIVRNLAMQLKPGHTLVSNADTITHFNK
jgi:hypothetical protein